MDRPDPSGVNARAALCCKAFRPRCGQAIHRPAEKECKGVLHSPPAFSIEPHRRRHTVSPANGCGCSSGVEHNLAKVGVEGSNPFARSSFSQEKSMTCLRRRVIFDGDSGRVGGSCLHIVSKMNRRIGSSRKSWSRLRGNAFPKPGYASQTPPLLTADFCTPAAASWLFKPGALDGTASRPHVLRELHPL